MGVHEGRGRHFQVQAVVGRRHAVIGSEPVRHENPLEAPLALEHLQVQEFVLSGVNAVDQVVGIHHRVHVSLGDGCLEGRQIDLAHGPLVYVHAHVMPVVLLTVQRVVLHCGDHALGLDAIDVRDHQSRIQEGVFGEIFEVAAGQR